MLTITIDTSKFAPEDAEYEVERALKGLAERWQTATKVMDLNGNSVGTVSYDETQSDETAFDLAQLALHKAEFLKNHMPDVYERLHKAHRI